MKRKELLIMLLLIFPSTLFAETIAINLKDIHESYSQKVKVSGSFYLGIQFKSEQPIDKLNVLFPNNSLGWLCIGISSIDGRYKATIEHELSAPTSGLVQLDFPSKYQEELKTYIANELAILARTGKSCDEIDTKSLLSSWNSSIENKNVILLIRSDARKDVVHVPNSPLLFKCKKFKKEYKVTYDKYCELKDVDISRVSLLEIRRKNLQEIPDELIKLAY